MKLETFLQKDNKIESEKYLKDGEQTKITPEIMSIAKNINSLEKDFDQKINDIISFVVSLKSNTHNKEEVFRKRTAGQIISDDFVTGCTDRALVFITLARAMSIPAKYIDAIDFSYLQGNSDKYRGHVYSAVLEEKGKNWIFIDPSRLNGIDVNIERDGRLIFAEGLDSWDIGIKSMKDVKNKFIHLKDNYKKTSKQ